MSLRTTTSPAVSRHANGPATAIHRTNPWVASASRSPLALAQAAVSPSQRRSSSQPKPIRTDGDRLTLTVEGHPSILHEARLAAPYSKCAASIPSAATRIPWACSCRTGRPPQPWRIAHSRTLRCKPTTCQTQEPAGDARQRQWHQRCRRPGRLAREVVHDRQNEPPAPGQHMGDEVERRALVCCMRGGDRSAHAGSPLAATPVHRMVSPSSQYSPVELRRGAGTVCAAPPRRGLPVSDRRRALRTGARGWVIRTSHFRPAPILG